LFIEDLLMANSVIDFQPTIELNNLANDLTELKVALSPKEVMKTNEWETTSTTGLGTTTIYGTTSFTSDKFIASITVQFHPSSNYDLTWIAIQESIKGRISTKYSDEVLSLMKLYFEPIKAHLGKQDYILDERRKLYVHLGNVFSTPNEEERDENWIHKGYQEATGQQETELLLWRM